MKHQDFREYRGRARGRASGNVRHFRPRQRRGRGRSSDVIGLVLIAVAVGAFAGLDWLDIEAPSVGPGALESRADRFAPEAPAPAYATAPAARVADPSRVQVVDGDTFWYAGEKIRIADIDTPEVRGACAYETQLAARATARMRTLLRAGPFELMPIERDEDQYGRKLRVVTRGGRSLGDQLVAEGLARTWTGRREPWC